MDGIYQCTATKGLQSWFNRPMLSLPVDIQLYPESSEWNNRVAKTMVHHLLQFHNSGSPHTLDWKKTLIITSNLGVANLCDIYFNMTSGNVGQGPSVNSQDWTRYGGNLLYIRISMLRPNFQPSEVWKASDDSCLSRSDPRLKIPSNLNHQPFAEPKIHIYT